MWDTTHLYVGRTHHPYMGCTFGTLIPNWDITSPDVGRTHRPYMGSALLIATLRALMYAAIRGVYIKET